MKLDGRLTKLESVKAVQAQSGDAGGDCNPGKLFREILEAKGVSL